MQTQRHNASNLPPLRTLALTGIVLGSVGGGALVGAALTAFLTPMSGRELRRKISSLLTAPQEEPDEGSSTEEHEGYDSGEIVLDEIQAG